MVPFTISVRKPQRSPVVLFLGFPVTMDLTNTVLRGNVPNMTSSPGFGPVSVGKPVFGLNAKRMGELDSGLDSYLTSYSV